MNKTILEYDIKVNNAISTYDNVFDSMAQNAGSSDNSPDVRIQDKIIEDVDMKTWENVNASLSFQDKTRRS
jgi:hypothetical protein